jgi:hypothetical protein
LVSRGADCELAAGREGVIVEEQPTLKLGTSVYSAKRNMCPVTFCNNKCININLFHSSAISYTFIIVSQNVFLHANGGLFLNPAKYIAFILPRAIFTVSFSENMLTTDKVKWLQQTALCLISVGKF